MKAAVIVFPASNCDRDMKVALEAATGNPVEMLWHGNSDIPQVDLIVLPGGFSYGDYLRCGAVAANSPIMKEVVRRSEKGVPVMGVCNGFQVLTEAGLLPGALLANAGLKFVCRQVHIQVQNSQTVFTNGYGEGDVLTIPVAHHDGQYFADDDALAAMEDNDQIAFRYIQGNDDRKANPNGSARDIAGVFNQNKTVLGMMPHPERAVDSGHGGLDGKALFDGLLQALS
jgi:phosphoribosylformylglycinamidine synthase I